MGFNYSRLRTYTYRMLWQEGPLEWLHLPVTPRLIVLFPVGTGVVEETVTSKPSICVWKSLQLSHMPSLDLYPCLLHTTRPLLLTAMTSNKISNRQSNSLWLFYCSKKQTLSSVLHLKKNLPGVRLTRNNAATCKTKQESGNWGGGLRSLSTNDSPL